jgi:NAD(P)-dependent dehydrogenase (short-subunit alcohol dehydrogenase family)
LITGANAGIGFATALSFALAGVSKLALTALSLSDFSPDTQAQLEMAGARHVILLAMDVLSPSSLSTALSTISQDFKHLDILVNNAGYMAAMSPIASSEEDSWWRTFEINLLGTYRVTKAALPLLLSSQLKTIINLNSIAAHNLRPSASAYGTSKNAVLRFTEFLMMESEIEGNGLLAYCVHPGAIMTKLAESMPRDTWAGLTDTPEMAADTIAFLTQERREWLGGRYVSCQWDMEELLKKREEIEEGDKLKMRLIL